jgi:hypothetical protein
LVSRPTALSFSAAILCACGGTSSSTSGDGGTDAKRAEAAVDVIHNEASKPHDAGGLHANGTLGTWQTLAPMPLPRANHCAVAAGGYLVVIGGNYASGGGNFVTTDAVDVAALKGDGTVGPWSDAGKTPLPVFECTATASGSTIYLVDGIYCATPMDCSSPVPSDQGHMFSAELSANGKLGPWKSLGPLPKGQDALYSNAWIATDTSATLYAMDARMNSTSTLHIGTSPTLGMWSDDDWLPGFLAHAQYAFTGAYVYVLGGYDSTADASLVTVAGGNGAPIEASGKVGAAFATQALPTPVAFGQAVAADDWIFLVGGASDVFVGPGLATAQSSQVGAGGQLGKWGALSSLPEGRRDQALTLAGDFLYLTGGGYTAGGFPTVFAARVRF